MCIYFGVVKTCSETGAEDGESDNASVTNEKELLIGSSGSPVCEETERFSV